MEELLKENELKIENDLYELVMLLIESEYNIEGVLNSDKKDSTRIVFKDRKAAINKVAEVIEKFSEENNLDKNYVKNHLIQIIEKRANINKGFKEEFEEAKEIITEDREDEER